MPHAFAQRNAIWLPLVVIAAIWLAADLRWIATDTVVPWDSKNQFYAFFRFIAAEIHSGHLPLWNPYHYGGHPSVADPQSLLFAPSFVLWGLLDPAPSLRAFDLIIFAHLLVGGLAIAVIGYRARWPAVACVLAAAVFMFGGAAAGRLQHTGQILSYAEFPPALLFLQLALQRRSIWFAVAFAATAAILTLGRNQTALMLSYLLIAAVIAEIAAAEQPLKFLRTRIPVLLSMAVVGIALVGPPLLLTVQFADLSNRVTESLSDAYLGSLYPPDFANLTVANVFGTFTDNGWAPGGDLMPQLIFTDESFNYLFVGWAPIVLLLWFGVVGRGAWRHGRRLLTIALVVAVLYMLGRYTPFFALAYKLVPGVAEYRRPVDANFMFDAALALLAGHLVTDYIRDGLPPRRPIAMALCVAMMMAALAAGVIYSFGFGHGWPSLVNVLTVAPIGLVVMAVLALARTAQERTLAAIGVTAIAVAELLCWNVAFRLNAEPRQWYAALEQPRGAEAHAFAVVKTLMRADHSKGERPRVELLGLGGPEQNTMMVQRIESISGYNPMRIGRTDRLVALAESNWLVNLRDFPPTFSSWDSPLAHALGLEYLMLGAPLDQIPNLQHIPVAEMLLAGPPVWIYRLPDTLPRVTFSDHVRIVDSEATDRSGHLLNPPESGSVLIDGRTPPSHSYVAGAVSHDACIVAWTINQVDIEANSADGGVLVLHDPYYPGWVATVDGRQVPILRADVLFRGVEVPPGHHHVRFTYEPFSLGNLEDAFARLLRGGL